MMLSLIIASGIMSRAVAARAHGHAPAAAAHPRAPPVPHGDRPGQRQEAPALVLHRGRGSRRRQAARQEVLLPQDPRRAPAAHVVSPHVPAPRPLHLHRLPPLDEVPVRAVPQVAPRRARHRGDRLPAAARSSATPRRRARASPASRRTGRNGRRGEFHGLREFRDGDDPRDIHWRSTRARRGRTLVREHEDEAARRVTDLPRQRAARRRSLPRRAGQGRPRARHLARRVARRRLPRARLRRARGHARRRASPPWLQGPPQLVRLLRTLALLPTTHARRALPRRRRRRRRADPGRARAAARTPPFSGCSKHEVLRHPQGRPRTSWSPPRSPRSRCRASCRRSIVGAHARARPRSRSSSSRRASRFLRARSWTVDVERAHARRLRLDAARRDPRRAPRSPACASSASCSSTSCGTGAPSRDYLQAYVVSFLMLVAGAALNSDLAYAGCFLAYVVFATWTLTLFHLRREMEENYLLKHSDDARRARRGRAHPQLAPHRRLALPRRAPSLVSIGVFLCAALAFFLIPRFGFGFFATHQRRGEPHRRLLRSRRPRRLRPHQGQPAGRHAHRVPVGRARPSSRCTCAASPSTSTSTAAGRAPSSRRRRCAAGAATTSTSTRRRAPHRRRGARAARPRASSSASTSSRSTPRCCSARRTPVAFELPRSVGRGDAPIALEHATAPTSLRASSAASTRRPARTTVERKSGLRYTVWSDVDAARRARCSAAARRRRHRRGAGALPRRCRADLPPRIARAGAADHRGRARPVAEGARHRATTCSATSYTLDLKRDERYEPLEDFLFVQKAGHCEYFASALAVMLRTVGVPTRSVNGFYGGEWNSYGHYLAVRQGDAHSWVEVWVDGAGWVTVRSDAARRRRSRRRRRVERAAPARSTTSSSPGSSTSSSTTSASRSSSRAPSDAGRSSAPSATRSALRARHARAGSSASRARARRLVARGARLAPSPRADASRIRRGAEALHAYARALKALERRGFARGAGETGRELAARVERRRRSGRRALRRAGRALLRGPLRRRRRRRRRARPPGASGRPRPAPAPPAPPDRASDRAPLTRRAEPLL